MSTINKIRHLDHMLAHELPTEPHDVMIVTDAGGAVTIDDTAVAREIMAATRRIIEAHRETLAAEANATRRSDNLNAWPGTTTS